MLSVMIYGTTCSEPHQNGGDFTAQEDTAPHFFRRPPHRKVTTIYNWPFREQLNWMSSTICWRHPRDLDCGPSSSEVQFDSSYGTRGMASLASRMRSGEDLRTTGKGAVGPISRCKCRHSRCGVGDGCDHTPVLGFHVPVSTGRPEGGRKMYIFLLCSR